MLLSLAVRLSKKRAAELPEGLVCAPGRVPGVCGLGGCEGECAVWDAVEVEGGGDEVGWMTECGESCLACGVGERESRRLRRCGERGGGVEGGEGEGTGREPCGELCT